MTTWVQVVPVGDDEFEYARKHGVQHLIDLFVEQQVDVFDINRPSVAPA